VESVEIKEFHATEAYSSLDLTNAKYSMKRLSIDEKKSYNIKQTLTA
jgi:hypothetical protein